MSSDKTPIPPQAVLSQYLFGAFIAQSMGAAARLRLMDLIVKKPSTSADLANEVGAHAESLGRLLNTLVALGLLSIDESNRYSATPLGVLAQVDAPGCMGGMALALTDTLHWAGWSKFVDVVKEGKSQLPKIMQTDIWSYYKQHPQEESDFSVAMTGISALSNVAVVEGYDYSKISSIVDVAGAYGALLGSILAKYPSIKGVLFDRPSVVEEAPKIFTAAHGDLVAERVSFVGGDFFVSVPGGYDLYLLKLVLHDWDDEHSVKILESLAAAMRADSKLMIVETAMPGRPTVGDSFPYLMDIHMMTMLNARERTAAQYEDLLQRAGLKTVSYSLTKSPMALLVAELK